MKYSIMCFLLIILISCQKEELEYLEQVEENPIGRVLTYHELEGEPKENWTKFATPLENVNIKFYHKERSGQWIEPDKRFCIFKASTTSNENGEFELPFDKLGYVNVEAEIGDLEYSGNTSDCRRSNHYDVLFYNEKRVTYNFSSSDEDFDWHKFVIWVDHATSNDFASPKTISNYSDSIVVQSIIPNINYKIIYNTGQAPKTYDTLFFYSGEMNEELEIDIEF